MTDKEQIDKEKFKEFETGQAWLYLQKKSLIKAVEPNEPTGVWAKVAMECERNFKKSQDRLRALIQEKEELTKKP